MNRNTVFEQVTEYKQDVNRLRALPSTFERISSNLEPCLNSFQTRDDFPSEMFAKSHGGRKKAAI